jgi:hypothetical protein
VADGNADTLETQILEVQELGLSTEVFRKKTGPQSGPVAFQVVNPRLLAVVPMMPVIVVMPTHLGRRLLRAFLDRRGGAGIGQRQRLSGWSSKNEQCANSGKP